MTSTHTLLCRNGNGSSNSSSRSTSKSQYSCHRRSCTVAVARDACVANWTTTIRQNWTTYLPVPGYARVFGYAAEPFLRHSIRNIVQHAHEPHVRGAGPRRIRSTCWSGRRRSCPGAKVLPACSSGGSLRREGDLRRIRISLRCSTRMSARPARRLGRAKRLGEPCAGTSDEQRTAKKLDFPMP